MIRELKDYLKAEGISYREFGRLVGTSGQYIAHIISGFRKPGPKLAKMIEAASGGRVSLAVLRPDLWPDSGNGNGSN